MVSTLATSGVFYTFVCSFSLFAALFGSFLLWFFGGFKYLVLEFFLTAFPKTPLGICSLSCCVHWCLEKSLSCRGVHLVDSASKLGFQFESVLKETNKSNILVWSYLILT